MTAGPRVLLMQLSERTSAKGNAYLSGWLGKASVVAFQAEEPDKWGNPVWDVFVFAPEPRGEAGPERRPQNPDPGDGRNDLLPKQVSPADRTRLSHTKVAGDAPAKPSAPPRARGDGWRGSRYVRPANGDRRAPVTDDAPFFDDSLEDIDR